jgi:NADP-reducing hydrogenase subunit HndD
VLRKSHENPFITKLYAEFLKEPLGHKSHELLHTHYTKRGRYNEFVK